MTIEEKKNAVSDKLFAELNQYKCEVENLTPKEIIDRCYMLALRDEIADTISSEVDCGYFAENELDMMLLTDDLLGKIYQRIMNSGFSITDLLVDTTREVLYYKS